MPFVSHDPRSGKGGKRPGAGRPSREATKKKLAAAELARAMLEAEIRPIVQEYVRLARGGVMKKGQSPQTTRHCIERWLAPAKASLQIDAKISFEQLIADLEAEELLEKQRERELKEAGGSGPNKPPK